MAPDRLRRRDLLAGVTGAVTAISGCSSTDSDQPTETDTDSAPSTGTATDADPSETTAESATISLDATIQNDSVLVGETVRVGVVVENQGTAASQRTLVLTEDGLEADTATVTVQGGGEETATLTFVTPSEPGTVSLELNGERIGEVTVIHRTRLHVAPDGSDDAVGTPDDPVRTIGRALERARPGTTVQLAPGEYRELLRTRRDGEPDAPITVTGPPEAVIRPPLGVYNAVRIDHNHFHLRGVTINGLVDPERKYEDYRVWIPWCVSITPLRRRDEGLEYLRDIVVEPSRIGNSAQGLIQVERVRNASIGNFEVIGPAGMQFDPRVDNHEVGHIREIVYVGSPEVHRGEDHYKYETLDRSRDIRIHHIDNSEGYAHNELVDVKLGSSDITVEYCTDRNAGHNSEGVVNAAIDVKGNDCTVRWNDIGECPLPVSFGAWAPSEDVDGGDWSRNNAVYGNHIHDFIAGPFRLRNEGDIGPVSFDDQRTLCGNRIERGELDVEPWMADANGFDGLVDRRGTDEVTVEVGTGPDGRALDPAAVIVDRGTTITWDWVDGSGSHYIVDRLRVASDPESVPDPRPAPYSESKTLDLVGMTRFACYAHHQEGMIGAVVVADDPDRYAFAQAACDGDVPDGDGVGHAGGDGRWS
ncbi:DUF1565 domain-containing protein [Halostella salina]|uniref:DUF1565 domain-containing protein n=1 Tax=Halostella salina TaxID=1547897 RepID=UPI000EF84CF4|nr:DUF1565 domain-containing protein [Halostella salina]